MEDTYKAALGSTPVQFVTVNDYGVYQRLGIAQTHPVRRRPPGGGRRQGLRALGTQEQPVVITGLVYREVIGIGVGLLQLEILGIARVRIVVDKRITDIGRLIRAPEPGLAR